MERGTHVPDGRIPQTQREDMEMVWTCAKARLRCGHEKDTADDSKWKSKQTKTEMARSGERGYGQKPDDE